MVLCFFATDPALASSGTPEAEGRTTDCDENLMPHTALPRGLYAITPDEPDTARLVANVRAALAGGAAIIQYRNKQAGAGLARAQARALAAACREAGVPFIVNDDLDLALETDAGLHLGAADGDIAAARSALGPHRLLGASCYDELERAVAAQRAGADHVAFGAVFASTTKPHAKRAPLALFSAARDLLQLPAVAIGGITADNAAEVLRAGAHAVAVVSDLFDAPDITAQARRLQRLFATTA